MTMKRCGLVIRVSTDRQASNPEGSLTNQLQKLRAHIEYKNTVGGEEWTEAGRYVLKAVSGKDSMRSKEFAQLFEDMKTGKVNTVVCTALDRISRSVKDFLNFFEVLTKYNVEFVCLKQNYDTTTSQGKLFITIMMALAEFEREQTSERTREAVMARAERGLWNGSQLFGYDLPPDKKGTLIPNPQEAAIVNVTFDYYLTCGSIFETAKELNRRGYRLKSYTSRRDVYHAPKPFTYTGVHVMLTNAAYIGVKEINKGLKREDQETLPEAQRYRLVKAAWPQIVDQAKFEQAQKLMAINDRSNRNGAKPIRHTYVLNGGLLWCELCGGEMEGRSGTSHRRQVYFYYKCKNAACGFKAPADEVESIVLRRIRQLATRTDLLADMVEATNAQLQEELPRLREQQLILKQELEKIQQAADRLMDTWAQMASTDGRGFLKDKLETLGKRRKEIEVGLDTLGTTIAEIEREAVNQEQVIGALQQVSQVFETLPPYEQKDLFRHTLHKALISPDRLKLALYGKPPQVPALQTTRAELLNGEGIRSEPFEWLPGLDSNQGHAD